MLSILTLGVSCLSIQAWVSGLNGTLAVDISSVRRVFNSLCKIPSFVEIKKLI